MTQKERVLVALQKAGERGVRSDQFYRDFNGRGVARIYDLRREGYEITAEPEGKYKRYRLVNSGVGAGCLSHSAGESQTASVDSGVKDHHGPGGKPAGVTSSDEGSGSELELTESRRASAGGPERTVPSYFDHDADWVA